MSQQHMFITSPSTNQVQVFQDGQHQGVLKINNSKFFNSVRNVHTYKTTPNSIYQVSVTLVVEIQYQRFTSHKPISLLQFEIIFNGLRLSHLKLKFEYIRLTVHHH